MLSRDFLLLNGVIVTLLVAWFLLGRRRLGPTPLKMTGKSLPPPSPHEGESTASGFEGARDLNCIFNYNGHSWDAWEVLSIPAGSPLIVAEAAFKETLKRNQGSELFLRAALDAIRSRQLS